MQPARLSGRFVVARRPQAYGADLWCIVELDGGRPVRLLDVTSAGDLRRPSDIAWRIQMAQDALAGRRQVFRVARNDDTTFVESSSRRFPRGHGVDCSSRDPRRSVPGA